MVTAAPWPAFDAAMLTEDAVRVLPVQVNGKRRGEISAPAGAEPADVEKMVLDDPEIARRLEGLTIRKVIVVADRIVNIVVGSDREAGRFLQTTGPADRGGARGGQPGARRLRFHAPLRRARRDPQAGVHRPSSSLRAAPAIS